MNNLFFIGGGYASKTYTFALDYVLGTKFDRIYVLGETNKRGDVFIDPGVDFTVADNFGDSLSECGTVLVTYSESFTKESFAELKRRFPFDGRRIIEVSLENSPVETPPPEKPAGCDLPTVLLLSASEYSQSYEVEIYLNRVMKGENVRLKQIFSRGAENFLSEIDADEPYVGESMRRGWHDCELLLRAADLLTLKRVRYDKTISDFDPDYVILLTDGNVSADVASIFANFEMRYGLRLSALLCSQFVEKHIWADRANVIYRGSGRIYLRDTLRGNIILGCPDMLRESLIDAVSLPDSIDRIDLNDHKT
ncbi:MAG: hypothetical protein LUH43_06155 [Clostridia bacterium]|nr:hypothetical protein [Clostridia bacterium]